MKATVFGAVGGALIVVLVGTFVGRETAVFAQRPVPYDASAELITVQAALVDKDGKQQQQITVIDPRTQALAVYHIDLATGIPTLKSVRNVHWDLQMVEFNGTTPLPREIRALLESR